MSAKLPFHASGDTVLVAATTAGATAYAITVTGSNPQVMLTNTSTIATLVNFGDSTVTATIPTTVADSAGYVVPPSGTIIVTPGAATYAAGVVAAGTNSVYATPGSGGS